MQKLQDSVFSIFKTTNFAPAVFHFLQPTEDCSDEAPLGGILKDTRHGWLALGPKFCVVDLRSGMKVASRTFGSNAGNSRITVTSVVELPTPMTKNSTQLIISLDYDNVSGMICVLHINGSQLLCCIQTEVVISELAVCDNPPEGPLAVFDNMVIAGTRRGEILVFDLNRASLMQALIDLSHVVNEDSATNIKFLPLKNLHKIEQQRDLAIENNDHLGIILNEDSLFDGQYIFRNPDGTVKMRAKRDHIRVTSLQYIPQLGSLAVGYNFGAFQIWNLLNLELEFTSSVNTECLPVTHFGFQEPCDDPRAFCYLWVIYSVIDRFEEEQFPLAVLYSLSYIGKRMLSESECLFQEFSSATFRFQMTLCASADVDYLLGGRCVSCHTYTIESHLGEEGEDCKLNICQLVWECWGENASTADQYGMLLFDLDQWYKDQMPASYTLESSAFLSVKWLPALGSGRLVLDARLQPGSVVQYSRATRLEEHFFPNSLQYHCVCLNTSEVNVLRTVGIQRQIIYSIDEAGPTALLSPGRLYKACITAGLSPLYTDVYTHSYETNVSQEEQRRFLLSVALEARLSRFLIRCAHDWATGTHSGLGCTLEFLVDWCWKRAIELKENAKDLASPLFTSSTLPDRNIVRCLDSCVQQLTQLTELLDAILTKCCNLVVPNALSEMEERHKGVGTVSLYFRVVQWFLGAGLLPERHDTFGALPYPADELCELYKKRRLKLHRLENNAPQDEEADKKPCSLLYIDQLIEREFAEQKVHEMWLRGGSECGGLYPPPSLYCLLRLYLLPDIAEEHKHSLVLYLLLDYSKHYDDIRYETVICRLKQFPTMFGLSNTAIKATQAFWHLDHRDFEFALDQLQCLSGNALSGWQHSVVLSSLMAQKKSQAALQYLHARRPPPSKAERDGNMLARGNARDLLDDWQSFCHLYLARGLVFEALDVIRTCVENAPCADDKVQVLNFFFKGCRNTGQLSKVMQVPLSPAEEEVFIKYLKDCNDMQTSDILIMFFLQKARYLEAQQYNERLREYQNRVKDLSASAETLAELDERSRTRDALVNAACSALPNIARQVARTAAMQLEPRVIAPRPMSVYVKPNSPKHSVTYKSSFIQDSIENASATWINKPELRKGLKRVLDIDNTPFICTPRANRTKSLFSKEVTGEATPSKRAKLELSPKTPKGTYKLSSKLSEQMATLLNMPDEHSPGYNFDRSSAGTPQSILKTRRNEEIEREPVSPTNSLISEDGDDEQLETISNHTNNSDLKMLRFTIPRDAESGPHRGPVPVALHRPDSHSPEISELSDNSLPSESPPKKLATEAEPQPRKTYRDSVRARLSTSPVVSENPRDYSIADHPESLINPASYDMENIESWTDEISNPQDTYPMEREMGETSFESRQVPTPRCRRGIRDSSGESTPRHNRSRSRTPESPLAPIPEQPNQELATEPHPADNAFSLPRRLRSRSRTPELMERGVAQQPALEVIPEALVRSDDSEPETYLHRRRNIRSRSRTPDLLETSDGQPSPLEAIRESESESASTPRSRSLSRSRLRTPDLLETSDGQASPLEAIRESPTRSYSESASSPSNRSLSSRSRTPEVKKMPEPITGSPKSLRSRSRTPEVEKVPEPITGSPRSMRSRSRTPEVKKNPEPITGSPRSLRSRSRTPEIEKITEPIPGSARSSRSRSLAPEVEKIPDPVISSPRGLRSRSMTPEKPTPKKDYGAKARKPLSRLVLEANTFAKTKFIGESKAEETTTTAESTDESTPVKANRPASLMDVTFSPIVNESILQSSSESFSVSEKVVKMDESNTSADLKTLPAFTTIHEVYTEKSILHSYHSSVETTREEAKIVETTTGPEIQSLPAFTINETDFNKSVLKSYDSSVAECSTSDDNKHKGQTKVAEVLELKPLNETDFAKSVLGSHQSSIAESNESDLGKSQMKDVSSLMTSDSEFENEDAKWKYGDNTARDIQKEKERIVEIEREINEIEEDFSEDSSDEEAVEIEELEEEESSEASASSANEADMSDSHEEVILIDDSDSEKEADTHKPNEKQSEISEQMASGSQTERIIEVNVETNTETDIDAEKVVTTDKNIETEEEMPEIEEEGNVKENIVTVEKEFDDKNTTSAEEQSTDVLNQANLSLLTDDNSAMDTDDVMVNLNYSDDSKDKEEVQGSERALDLENVQPKVQMKVEVMVEPVAEVVDEDKSAKQPATEVAMVLSDITPAELKPIEDKQTAEEISESNRMPEEKMETEVEEISESNKMEGETEKTGVGEISESIKMEVEKEEIKAEEISESNRLQEEKKETEVEDRSESNKMEEDKKETEVEEISESNRMQEEKKETEVEEISESNRMQEEKKETEVEEISESNKMEEEKKKSKAEKIKEKANEKEMKEEPKVKKTQEGLGRKRSIPTSSKTSKESETIEHSPEEKSLDSPKTPMVRKRTPSTSSNKSAVELQYSPEDPDKEVPTPSRRLSKTPTTEVRKILTRRASKEMSEKIEPDPQLEESLTPRRRSTRTRSRSIDDDATVASGSSVKSNISKASEDLEGKPAPRKGRKSILNPKTDLSVIPEVAAEDSSLKESSEEVASESSTKKRQTRGQKAESWVQPAPRGRRASVASRTSNVSNTSIASLEEEDTDPLQEERIHLLDKDTYEGPPDLEELHRASPVSLITDPAKPRLARAASESKSVPTTKKPSRRVSVDMKAVAEAGAEPSPVRGRRASFNRACEALHTPKGKATPDAKQSKAEETSITGTPKRKPRRASVQSDVATPDAETSKRSRKTATEKAKDSAE